MANAQEISGRGTHPVYGAIWRRTIDEFARVIPREIAGATLIRPKRAGYKIVKVGGVPLYPWRYAKDLAVDPDLARLGNTPSDTRIEIFKGLDPGHEQLVLDFGALDADLTDLGAEEDLQAAEAVVAELAAGSPTVVAVQYASNPSALLRIRWCDAVLRGDGSIWSDFAEDLDLPTNEGRVGYRGGVVAVGDPWGPRDRHPGRSGDTFSDAPLAVPPSRPGDPR
jgi:hypothetical protein